MHRLLKVFTGLVIAGIAILAVIGIASLFGVGAVATGTVVRIELDGTLGEKLKPQIGAMFGAEVSPALPTLVAAIRRAADDPKVVGVVLDIKQPQLALAQVQEIEAAMAKVRASGKWNTAFLRTAGELEGGTSAYAVAVTASQVVLTPPGTINLTGVRAETPFVKETLERLQIKPYVERRKAYKTAGNMFTHTGFTPEHRESLASVLGDVQRQLVDHLAARRNVPAERVRGWFEAASLGSQEALDQGLVDKVDYWQSIADAMAGLPERDKDNGDETMSIGLYIERGDEPRGAVIAFITVEGSISQGGRPAQVAADASTPLAFGRGGTSAELVTQALRDARKKKEEVKGVLLRVNSPGGSYVASDLIRSEVEVTRKAGIPIVVSMSGLAASGGYFVAMDANHIVAQPATVTGSIGVLTGMLPLRQAMQHWLGVTWDTYESVPNSAAISWLDPPNDRQRQLVTRTLDRIYADFVTKAAAGRKTTFEAIDAVAQGRIWSGEAALKAGLVDELGGLEEATQRLRALSGLTADEPIELHHFPQPRNVWELIQQFVEMHATALGLTAGSAHVDLSRVGDARLEQLLQLATIARDPADAVLLTPVRIGL